MSKTAVLMSIKPKYAKMIFDGSKTIELRRVCPKLVKGDLVLVYVSGPRMALVGGFEVEGVVSSSPTELRQDCLSDSGISKEAFDTYFQYANIAFGIKIGRTWKLEEAADLKSLRRRKGGFQPPQSYRYLKNGEFETLLS